MTLDADSISAYPLLSIEIGGTKLQLVVGTREGLRLARRRFSVEKDHGAEEIRECIKAALPELLKEWMPKAIGVGYGGPVNWRTGRIVKSYHLSRWNDFPLAEWLHDLSGLPVFVENDANVEANVEALGEALGGAGRGCEPWREAVARHLRHCVMDAFQPGPRVALSALRGDAVPVGALAPAA
jgi:predicted NBD/HSP70 family sugar kinase